MKKYIMLSAILVVVAAVSSPSFAQKKEKKTNGEPPDNTAPVVAKPLFANNNDTISYIIGADIAHSFAKNSLDLNRDLVFKGFIDAQAKADTIFTEEQIGAIMMAWQQQMSAKKAAQSEIELAKNKKIGEVIFTADWHPANHCSFKRNGGEWNDHCVQFSKGAAIHD